MTDAYSLDAAIAVLTRPDGAVQLGWDPRRALLVHPPAGLSATALASVLRTLQARTARASVLALGRAAGAHRPDDLLDLLARLVTEGVCTRHQPSRPTSLGIRVHGAGPLADVLATALRCSGVRVTLSDRPTAALVDDRTHLVVLSDALVADPRILLRLHAARMPHLAVRIRDGTGLVGPLVVPGVTSCLRCADLHRTDRDQAWPALAAQLRDAVGTADRATVLATAALALAQIDRVLRALRGAGAPPQPQTLDATLEFDVAAGVLTTRRWTRHPDCDC